MNVITRDEAYRTGKKHFYTGRACARGHLSERYVVNGGCVACQSWRTIPSLSNHNTAVPPSPYAFPLGVTPTPELVSYVHSRVLQCIPEFCKEYETTRATLSVSEHAQPVQVAAAVLAAQNNKAATEVPEGYRLTPLAGNAKYATLRKQRWTDAALVDNGYMERIP